MAFTPESLTIKDFGAGMDQKSSENAIQPGYSERLTNVVANTTGSLSKRAGYEGYYGWLPLRVSRVDQSGTSEIKIFFDPSVSLRNVVPTPIVIYGRLGVTGITSNDFVTTTDAGHYYATFGNAIPYTFSAPSGNTGGINSVGSVNVMTTTLLSTSVGTSSSELLYIDNATVSTLGSNDITYTWAGLADAIDVFLPTQEIPGTGGEEYIWAITTGASPYTTTLTAATHQLNNYTPVMQCFVLSGTTWQQAIPESFSINSSTGLISVTLTGLANSTSVKILLRCAAVTEVATSSITTSGSISISTTEDYYFVNSFSPDSVVISQNNYILANTVVRDDIADTLTFTYASIVGTEIITAFFIPAEVQSNFLTVLDNTGAGYPTFSDTSPQMTVWGISHEDICLDDNIAGARVTHIDSYSTDAEERMIAGIGGALFKASTYDESAAAYLLASSTLSMDDRVNATVTIGPVFCTASETSIRTNGAVVDSTIVANKALTTSVAYVSSGVSKYTLSLPAATGSLATAISVTSGLEDYLTVTGMAHSIHNGVFKITAVDNTAKTITVSNSLATSTRYDETGARGRSGVMTDRFAVQAVSVFLPDDSITVSSNATLTVLGSSGTTVIVKTLTEFFTLPIGVKLYASRSTSILPMTATTNFVSGDMCTLDDFDRKFRILYINASANNDIVSVTWSSTTATVTLTSDNHALRPGMKVNLLRTTDVLLNGTHTIVSVISASKFTITTSYTGSTLGTAGVLQGYTIEIDEVVTVADGNTPMTLQVEGRWLPIEAPTSTDTLVLEDAHYQYFKAADYIAQTYVRSSILGDNMYLTNYADAPLKFDGTNIYKSGLPYWQPQHFAATSTSGTSISLSTKTITVNGLNGAAVQTAAGGASMFSKGDLVLHYEAGTYNAVYTVQATTQASLGIDYIILDRTIEGNQSLYSGSTLSILPRLSYYFRLSAIDANGNILTSAVTGLNDYLVDYTTACVINHKLIGLPSFDLYDYDSINIEIYRTKAGQSAPYYKLSVQDIDFDMAKGYISFKDTTDDSLLSEFDAVNVALLGTEVGTDFSAPLRAKYITVANNSTVCANVQTYPQIDLTLVTTVAFADITSTDLDTKVFTVRKDNTDAGSTSNMVDRASYVFTASTTSNISAISIGSGIFTVTLATPTAIVAGDWVYLCRVAAPTSTNNDQLRFAGWYQIKEVTTPTTVFTISGYPDSTWGSWTTTEDVNRCVWIGSGKIPVFLGTDYNINTVDGNDDNVYIAIQRLAAAINTTQCMVDRTITGYTTFKPWLAAQSGSTIGAGRLLLRQDQVETTTFEVTLPSITGTNWYAFDTVVPASTDVQAESSVFTSRVIVSYPGYAELFQHPGEKNSSTKYVIDVSASDGQEITGILPFFSETAFGQATSEASIIVFKDHSVHILHIDTGASQKLQTRGLGCTAPRSIAYTKDGIMFANHAGLYRVNRDLTISYVGEYLERIYQDEVNRDALDAMTATHNTISNQYRISVPTGTDTSNDTVLVYDHQREGKNQQYGAWSEFTNFPATGWANLNDDAFFASSTGQVFRLRNLGDSTDYRDDADAVDTMVILLRADDFGSSGERKLIMSSTSHFEMRHSDNTGTILSVAYDLQSAFEQSADFEFTDSTNVKVKFAKTSFPRRKTVYIQMKYTNGTKDESVILSGIDFNVAKLNTRGVPQAGNT